MLKKQNILNAGFQALWRAVPTLITLIVFTLYTATQPDHYLTPTVAFVSLSLFDKMKDGLNHLPHSIAYCIEVSKQTKLTGNPTMLTIVFRLIPSSYMQTRLASSGLSEYLLNFISASISILVFCVIEEISEIFPDRRC